MSTAGDYVGEEVWYRIVQIVTNTVELQEYASRKVYEHLRNPTCHENIVKVAANILGEFGHLIANEEDGDQTVRKALFQPASDDEEEEQEAAEGVDNEEAGEEVSEDMTTETQRPQEEVFDFAAMGGVALKMSR